MGGLPSLVGWEERARPLPHPFRLGGLHIPFLVPSFLFGGLRFPFCLRSPRPPFLVERSPLPFFLAVSLPLLGWAVSPPFLVEVSPRVPHPLCGWGGPLSCLPVALLCWLVVSLPFFGWSVSLPPSRLDGLPSLVGWERRGGRSPSRLLGWVVSPLLLAAPLFPLVGEGVLPSWLPPLLVGRTPPLSSPRFLPAPGRLGTSFLVDRPTYKGEGHPPTNKGGEGEGHPPTNETKTKRKKLEN